MCAPSAVNAKLTHSHLERGPGSRSGVGIAHTIRQQKGGWLLGAAAGSTFSRPQYNAAAGATTDHTDYTDKARPRRLPSQSVSSASSVVQGSRLRSSYCALAVPVPTCERHLSNRYWTALANMGLDSLRIVPLTYPGKEDKRYREEDKE